MQMFSQTIKPKSALIWLFGALFCILSLDSSSLKAQCVSGNTGGTVWRDSNNDGIQDVGETQGLAGVTVTAYDCNGVVAATTTTDALGQYTFATLTPSVTNKYRIEFSGLPPQYQATVNGTNGHTDVQIISAAGCNINMGVQPICQGSTNPAWLQKGYSLVSCLPGADSVVLAVKDIRQLGTLWDSPANRNNDQSGNVPTAQVWTKQQFGSNKVFGFAIDQRDGTIYVGTSELVADYQHSGGSILSTPIATQIYKIGPISSTPVLWATLPGNFGIGMLDIDTVHNQIFATNIDDGKIYRLALSTGTQISGAYDPLIADNGILSQLPVVGDAILGVAYNYVENRVYYSVWANNSQPFSIPAFGSTSLHNTIRSVALDVFGAIIPATDKLEITLPFLVKPAFPFSEPVIDIEFDATGTKVLLAETSIVSEVNITPPFRPAAHDGIMTEYVKTAGVWTLTPIPADNYNSKYDIGFQYNGSFGYYGANSRGGAAWAYKSISNGKIIGDDSFVISTGDALHVGSADPDWIYGYQFIPATGGNRNNSVLVNFGVTTGAGTKYTYNDVDIFKGIYCNPKIEIGNYVWIDSDKDGVQDPCETPLSNVTVSLWKAGVQIASTTTVNGEYYFSSKSNLATPANWTGMGADTMLLPNMAYEIHINTTNQTQLDTLKLTVANTTTNSGNDQNDSDASITGNYAVIAFTTGAEGSTNHTYDFGFFPCYKPALLDTTLVFCGSQTINLTSLVRDTAAATKAFTAQSYHRYYTKTFGLIADSTAVVVATTDSFYVIKDPFACLPDTMKIKIDINFAPTITGIAVDTATCSAGVANSDAKVHVTGIVGMTKYAYSTSGTAGLFALTATSSTASSIDLMGITNPASAATYTFRLWGVDTTCFNDTTLVLTPSVCPIPCATISQATDTTFCSGVAVNLMATLTNITTENIQFVYFTSHQTDPSVIYGGTGTTIGTVNNASLTNTKTKATLSNFTFPANSTGSPMTYHVYAIANPASSDASCRPYGHRHYIINSTVNAGADVTLLCAGGVAPTTANLNQTATWTVVSQPSGANAAINGAGYATALTVQGAYVFQKMVNGCTDTVTVTVPTCAVVCPPQLCIPVIVTRAN
jgi:hypothetical protein